jgi:hypothetical protein
MSLNSSIPTQLLSTNWRYRSFRNRSEHIDDINDLLFGEAELELMVAEDGVIDGYLRFGALGRLKIDGKAEVEGRTTVLKFQGIGKEVGLGTSGWVYDYVCWFVPNWEGGVNQQRALVGSVIRTADHGQAKAGVVASFVAVQGLMASTPPPAYDIPMPEEIIAWMKERKWGDHHTRWHTERNWDLQTPEDLAMSVQTGWSRYPMQEGEEGNGLDFLAMHRVMIRMLRTAFPIHSALFDGWSAPPTDPFQSDEELPNKNRAPFSPLMSTAILRLSRDQELLKFVGDDELGRYMQTSLNPTPNEPRRRSNDLTAGIHNYLHNRWTLESSPIDLGKPEVNISNQRFWRLHGWIDKRWDQFRSLTGKTEEDFVYADALRKAEEHLNPVHEHKYHGRAIPESLHKAARRLLLKSL